MIVSSLQGFERLREQRGEDDPACARQGLKDRYEGLLPLLSGLSGLAGNRLSKQLAQSIELPVRLLELLGEKPDAFDEHADMRDSSFGDAWGDNQRLLFQGGENFGRADPSNAMADDVKGFVSREAR